MTPLAVAVILVVWAKNLALHGHAGIVWLWTRWQFGESKIFTVKYENFVFIKPMLTTALLHFVAADSVKKLILLS